VKKTPPAKKKLNNANIFNSGDYAVECYRCSKTAYMSDRVQCESVVRCLF
jgi:hypothetical protein